LLCSWASSPFLFISSFLLLPSFSLFENNFLFIRQQGERVRSELAAMEAATSNAARKPGAPTSSSSSSSNNAAGRNLAAQHEAPVVKCQSYIVVSFLIGLVFASAIHTPPHMLVYSLEDPAGPPEMCTLTAARIGVDCLIALNEFQFKEYSTAADYFLRIHPDGEVVVREVTFPHSASSCCGY